MEKLPQLTLVFWIMKICATTLGETAGDLFSMTFHAGYAVSSVVLLLGFGLSLAFQLRSSRYQPPLYWWVILGTSTAGTTLSDFLDRSVGLGYAKGSLLLLVILGGILATWKWTTGSLSIQNLRGRRSESFYWAAILVSNTLGTALGDFLADDSGLGFAGGALLIAGLLLLGGLAHAFTRISKTLLFWWAFILTRPFGATFGDYLMKEKEKGGLAFGTLGSSGVLAAGLLGLLIWEWKKNGRAGGT